jgi:uncharacterized repeat protein (TIGR03803 family)
MARLLQRRKGICGLDLRTAIAFAAGAILLIITASQLAPAQTLNALHAFLGPEGATPTAGVTMDARGNLFGTTEFGGASGYGMVFKLVHKGGAWLLNPLYSFPDPRSGNDGAEPYAGVIIGSDGNLYGTTTSGGGSAAYGTVFKLSPPMSVCKSTICPWTETILYRFTGGSDGGVPFGPVIFDSVGNLYGTTESGGVTCGQNFTCGVVFKLTRSGSTWSESALYAFQNSPDGAIPASGLVFDHAGNLYGTTTGGGTGLNCEGNGCGTVFQLAPNGSGWTESVLQSFDYTNNGAVPQGGLIIDSADNLYGTTVFSPGNNGNGTVFELTPSGGQWTYTLLSSIPETFFGITGPLGTLALDPTGNLYGTTVGSGDAFGSGLCQYGCGTVFELTSSGGSWVFNLLYQFTGDVDGAHPSDGVILDRNGNLYGTASAGGAGGYGVVFELTP